MPDLTTLYVCPLHTAEFPVAAASRPDTTCRDLCAPRNVMSLIALSLATSADGPRTTGVPHEGWPVLYPVSGRSRFRMLACAAAIAKVRRSWQESMPAPAAEEVRVDRSW
jgi:hypothetical protein